jgi:glycerol-3-phosphate acyltransferase PlsY
VAVPSTLHYFVVITALGALLGHNYSLFLHFKGGKGVATGLGLFAYLEPMAALVGFLIWAVIVFLTRYVSLGSIVGAICAAAMGFVWGYPLPYAIFRRPGCCLCYRKTQREYWPAP